jgi:hypothetical protein
VKIEKSKVKSQNADFAMLNETTSLKSAEPSEQASPTLPRADFWMGQIVSFANWSLVVVCALLIVARVVRSSVVGHLVEFALLLIPFSVSLVLAITPQRSRFRDLWCLVVLAVSPLAISYLVVETSTEYMQYKAAGPERSPRQLLLWGTDLLVWLYLLLSFMAMMIERHFRVHHDLAAKYHVLAVEKDKRIVAMEKTVAALQRRIIERDGY